MTKIQATKLTQEIAKEYLGKEWKKSLTDIQAEIWTDELIKFDHSLAKKTIRMMFTMHPACENPFNWKMPYLSTFTDYYEDIRKPKRDYCPCCAGTGWIYFESKNGVVMCDCNTNDPNGVSTLSTAFPNYPEAKCDSFQCAPRKDSPCPTGSQFYNAKKIEFMEKEKQKPGYKFGLTFHKPGGFVEGVVKVMGEMEDKSGRRKKLISF